MEGLIVASVLATTTNACVIGMVIFMRELRTFNNCFVVSLAVSDLLTGALILPLYLNVQFVVLGILTFIIFISGVLNLCAVTWDRYVAITDPFGYKDKLQRYHRKVLFAVWMTTTLCSFIPLAWKLDESVENHKWFLILSFLILVVVPYVFIVVGYVRICLRLRSHTSQIKGMDMTIEQREGARRASLEGKTVKVFLVVAFVFLVSWLPVIYINVVNKVLGRPDLVPYHLAVISLYSIAGSSLINPILYGIMKRDFFAQIRRIRKAKIVFPMDTANNAARSTATEP